jgi:hypothetical protein
LSDQSENVTSKINVKKVEPLPNRVINEISVKLLDKKSLNKKAKEYGNE